jgi:hypothetical protein
MRHLHTSLKLAALATAGAVLLAAAPPSAFAQTQSTMSSSSSERKNAPTSATPRMIDEAIQRSWARTDKLKTEGKPERFGSEEAFTYVPGKAIPLE